MASFLITYKSDEENSERGSPLSDVRELSTNIGTSKGAHADWRFRYGNDAAVGDRVFLLLQGKKGPALIGYGKIEGKPFMDGKVQRMPVEFEELVDPTIEVLASKEELLTVRGGTNSWHSYSSGVPLPPRIARHLEGVVAKRSRKQSSRSSQTSSMSDGESTGSQWSEREVRDTVSVYFEMLQLELRDKDYVKAEHSRNLRERLPRRSKQSIEYKFANISAMLRDRDLPYIDGDKPRSNYQKLLSRAVDQFLLQNPSFFGETQESSYPESDDEKGIRGRIDIDETQKAQLILARRGQGTFRKNVGRNEQKCRVTGVDDIDFLRASHIKPWSQSNDQEKLDGCNGLLLAPHIDFLFDKGLISFSDSGELLVSSRVARNILAAWGIRASMNVGSFSERQRAYLKFHRNWRFEE